MLTHSFSLIPFRAITTSFGSICFGSFLVALIQALRALANEAQNNGDAQILACIASCILGCIQGCVEYFNKWAFVYVGLYGAYTRVCVRILCTYMESPSRLPSVLLPSSSSCQLTNFTLHRLLVH